MIVELKASDIVPGHTVKPGGEYAAPYIVVDVAKRYEDYSGDIVVLTLRYSELTDTFDVHYDPDKRVTVSHIRRAKMQARSKEEVLEILKYLPSNYKFAYAVENHSTAYFPMAVHDLTKLDDGCKDFLLFIQGFDNCGWTLDGYVIPRLASGLYHAYEVYDEDTVGV